MRDCCKKCIYCHQTIDCKWYCRVLDEQRKKSRVMFPFFRGGPKKCKCYSRIKMPETQDFQYPYYDKDIIKRIHELWIYDDIPTAEECREREKHEEVQDK